MPRRAPLTVAGALVIAALSSPAPAAACTGEDVPLDEVIRTADAIVLARIVEVEAEVAIDVPGSWTLQVERVLRGSSPPRFSLTWPTSVGICDGFTGFLGDRLVMAVGAVGFNQSMSPYWLLETSQPAGSHAGARTDLELLAVRLGEPIASGTTAPPNAGPAVAWPVALGFTIGAGLAIFGALVVARLRGRQRGGL